jgi:hypothetical protein
VSDIGILRGMAAFLVAGGLGILSLLAFLVCLFLVGSDAASRKVALTRHSAFPHLRGLLLCLLGYGSVVLFLIATDGEWSFHDVNRWLDETILFWAGGILALWPFSVLATRRRQASAS